MKTDQKILIIECRAASSKPGRERMLSQCGEKFLSEKTCLIPKPVGTERKFTLKSISKLSTGNL